MRNCRCGAVPIIYEEGMARRGERPDGTEDFYFTDIDGYLVRCDECAEQTNTYRTKDKAIKAWEEGRVF